MVYNKKPKHVTRFLVILSMLFLISSSLVNASFWACMDFGQTVPLYTCIADCCVLCISNTGYPTDPAYCYNEERCGCGESQDQDGDGFTYFDDCDDSDPTIYPGAPEFCDGVDRNCDGIPSSARVHEADIDCDEQLEFYELHDYMGLWKINQKTMQDVLTAISIWNGEL